MRALLIATAVALGVLLAPVAFAEDDPRDVAFPTGWRVTKSTELSDAQVKAIGAKFGAELSRITNTVWSIGGLGIQVNVVTAKDEAAAKAAEAALAGFRGPGFVGRRGAHVVEIAGTNRLPAAFALAHLGLLPETPKTWRIDMKVGSVAELDYMTANKVFNQFLALDGDADEVVAEAIETLTKDWTMGRRVALLDASRPWFEAAWSFEPEPASTARSGDVSTFLFEDLPERLGVPYVRVTGTVAVRPRFTPVEIEGDPGTTEATRRWPADDSEIVARAKRVTAPAKTGRDRVRAIALHVWSEVRYAGETGSRYGVSKVLAQGHGHCWDKSDVFVTLCRAAGIPARQVAGWVPVMKSGHVWAEARIPGEGWISVDPTTPWLGTGVEYVPFYRTDDGEMPIVYVAWPKIEAAE